MKKLIRFLSLMASEETNSSFKIEPLLGVLAFLLLMIGCFFILRPFVTALMWAMILAYSLHPLHRHFTRWFRGSRTLAACFVTLMMTVVLAGPFVLIGFSVAQDGKDLAEATQKWLKSAPEQAPAWITQMPLVGTEMGVYWANFSEDRNRWMEQLDKEVKAPPPRPNKIVVESEDGLIVRDAPPAPPVDGAGKDEIGEKKSESPHVVVLLGQFIVWARG